MNAAAIFGKGISFPPRVAGGRIAWSVGEQNVREAIRVILMTNLNERVRLPEFGGEQMDIDCPVAARDLLRSPAASTAWAIGSDERDPRRTDASQRRPPC